MRYGKNDLFTTNYGVEYDKWVVTTPQNLIGGFFQSFTRGTYTINVSKAIYYLLVQIVDGNGKQVYIDYIKTVNDYKTVKKKLKWT
jgi:hypothetical protein